MSSKVTIKIMNKPDPTDEEIRSHMDFDKLLAAYERRGGATKQVPRWMITAGVGLLAVVVILTATYFYSQKSNSSSDQEFNPAVNQNSNSQKVLKDSSAIAPIKPATKEELLEKKAEKKRDAVSPPSAGLAKPAKDSVAVEQKKPMNQFTEATPVDGYPALYSYFDKELKYPKVQKDTIEGIVTVSFVIDEQGKPGRVKIENSLGEAFDAESRRLIENMPLWNPATINGKPVAVRASIPLVFKVKK